MRGRGFAAVIFLKSLCAASALPLSSPVKLCFTGDAMSHWRLRRWVLNCTHVGGAAAENQEGATVKRSFTALDGGIATPLGTAAKPHRELFISDRRRDAELEQLP
jgi:hypothetical protein